jgi:hypothetical protein
MMSTIKAIGGVERLSWRTSEQGFVDQHGKFYTRDEAWKIAEANGQLFRRFDGDGVDLYSENLY